MILEMPTIAERRKALERLPTDLNDSFRGIITRIRRRPTELGMQALMWIHFAHRPLKLIELQHALSVKESQKEFDADYIPSQKVLLDCCLGLILVDEETLTVRFTHFTIEEYFRINSELEFPNGHSYITETCLTYLNFGGLRQHCMDLRSLHEKFAKYAFLDYVALNWGTYFVKQQCSVSLTKLAGMVLRHDGEHPPCAIQSLYYLKLTAEWMRRYHTPVKKFSGVHVMAYFGLNEIMADFFKAELVDESGRTPLSWAAEGGQKAFVQLLIERYGVDINAKDNEGETPLMWAAKEGHVAVVRLLIERGGVNIDGKDNMGKTPLMWAAEKGHEAVVRLLIERDGVDINAKDNEEATPLMWAAGMGWEVVVRLLIERDGIDINAKDETGRTPLMWAAKEGRVAIVRLLIEREGVDIKAKDNGGATPLMWAALFGREAVVRLLIARDGVDINAKDNGGATPLMWAAVSGCEAVVRRLIGTGGVDINAKDNDGKTALAFANGSVENPPFWANRQGPKAVVRLLIERNGVDINATDNEGKTALSLADANVEREGLKGIVQFLKGSSDTTPAGSLTEDVQSRS